MAVSFYDKLFIEVIKIQGAFNRKMDDTAMRDTLQFMIDNSMINLDDVRENMRKE